MSSNTVDQPIVLYYETTSGTARAAAIPHGVGEDAFLFRGAPFVRTGGGLIFWDYLVLPNEDIVGILLCDFDVDESLSRSPLLTSASNVSRDNYGYYVGLTCSDIEPSSDGAQAFGCSLLQHGEECVLLLPDWHDRDYAFPLDDGLVEPLTH